MGETSQVRQRLVDTRALVSIDSLLVDFLSVVYLSVLLSPLSVTVSSF